MSPLSQRIDCDWLILNSMSGVHQMLWLQARRLKLSTACISRAGREPGFKKQNQDNCFAFEKFTQDGCALFGALDGHGPEGFTSAMQSIRIASLMLLFIASGQRLPALHDAVIPVKHWVNLCEHSTQEMRLLQYLQLRAELQDILSVATSSSISLSYSQSAWKHHLPGSRLPSKLVSLSPVQINISSDHICTLMASESVHQALPAIVIAKCW